MNNVSFNEASFQYSAENTWTANVKGKNFYVKKTDHGYPRIRQNYENFSKKVENIGNYPMIVKIVRRQNLKEQSSQER